MQNTCLPADGIASDDVYLVSAWRQHHVLLIDRTRLLPNRQLVFRVPRRLYDVFKVPSATPRKSGQLRIKIHITRIDAALILERDVRVLELNRERRCNRLAADAEEVRSNAERQDVGRDFREVGFDFQITELDRGRTLKIGKQLKLLERLVLRSLPEKALARAAAVRTHT